MIALQLHGLRTPPSSPLPANDRDNPQKSAWIEAIDEMVEQNGSLDCVITYDPVDAGMSAEQDEPFSQKLRPFSIKPQGDAEELLLERFTPSLDVPRPAPVGSRVDVYLSTASLRLVASHEVRDVLHYQLNERQRITVNRLVRIGRIMSAQRRAFFRVDTSAVGFGQVTLNNPGRAGMKLKPITGQLVNLSAGGVGLKVEGKADQLEDLAGGTFDFLVKLPEDGEMLTAPVKLCRIHQEDRQRVYLGLEFELDEDNPQEAKLAAFIARLTADLQRAQLRKRRRA